MRTLGLKQMKKFLKWFAKFLKKNMVVKRIKFCFVIVTIMERRLLAYLPAVSPKGQANTDRSPLALFRCLIVWNTVANLKTLKTTENR